MSFHLPTASPEVCKLQSALLCRRDWMMIRGFARSRFLHHLQESSVHRSARDWRLQLHVADEGGKCPVWPPVTSRLLPGAEWGPKYFLPPEISNTINWTLYCTLIQFTIIEIFTKVWRKGEELMGWHRTTAAVPVTGAVHLGTPAPLHRLQWRFCGSNIWLW